MDFGKVRTLWKTAGLAVALILTALPAFAANVIKMERIVVTVTDLRRTETFFHDGLDFQTVKRGSQSGDAFARLVGIPGASAKTLIMRLGSEEVEFVQYAVPGKPYPPHSASQDLWFQHFAIIVSDMDKAYAKLRRVPFTAISYGGPVTLPPQNGFVRAFKFRDPDGHPLELLYFPAGQGRATWQNHRDAIFLGIDHSAIGIANTAQSLHFYRDLLGMTVGYDVTNEGPTQQRLDGTFGALVHITGLHAANENGPGVEFLEYLSPPNGRAADVTSRANDVQHVELAFEADDIDGMAKTLQDASVKFVSSGTVTIGGGSEIMVRDPDGHAILINQRLH